MPALILFPGHRILVSDRDQTAQFFAASWAQYHDLDVADPTITVLAEAPGSIWADVVWDHGNGPAERFCYQLVQSGDDWQIAVLTPMALGSDR